MALACYLLTPLGLYFSGYMASEYSSKGIFSAKSDVFSFGSLLLEIISGKRNGTWYKTKYRKALSLHEYVSGCLYNSWKHTQQLTGYLLLN